MTTRLTDPQLNKWLYGKFPAASTIVPEQWDKMAGGWVPQLGRTGAQVRDVSRYGNHASLVGGLWLNDTIGNVIDLLSTGDNGVVIDGSIDGFINLKTAFTIEFWMYAYNFDNSQSSFYTEAQSTNTALFLFANGSGNIQFDKFPSTGGTTLLSVGNQPTDKWVHVQYTERANDTRCLFINGVINKEDSGNNEVYTGSTPNERAFGRRPNAPTRGFNGRMAGMHTYFGSISAREAMERYNDSLARFRLVLHLAQAPAAPAGGRIMGALAGHGGLAGIGGIAGQRGGMAG